MAAAKTEKWPETEFTPEYPGFYIDKLENGTAEDKERVVGKFINQYANNTLMNALYEYRGKDGDKGGLDGKGDRYAVHLLHEYYDTVIVKNEIFRLMALGNLLIGLGHPEYEGKEPKWMFNTRGRSPVSKPIEDSP